MPVDPQVQTVLDQMAARATPPITTLEPAVMRAGAKNAPRPPAPEVGKVEDRTVPGPGGEIPVRVYTPEGPGPFPALVWFHGGGWVLGDIEMADGSSRHLVNMAGCVVVSVDYRLAPEAKFPAAAEDCYTATAWVAANSSAINVDPSRIAVGGDSAGGNLAAVVPLMARDKGGPPIAHQLLINPVIERDFTTDSWKRNGKGGYVLSTEMMGWFWDHYLPEAERTPPIRMWRRSTPRT